MIEQLKTWIRARWIFLVLAAVLLAAGWVGLQFRDPEAHVLKRQTRLLKAITEKDLAGFASLVSEGYGDDWGFTRETVCLAMDDVSSQFISLQIDPQKETLTVSGDRAHFTARLRVDGRSLTAPGIGMLSMSASVQEPYVFTWQKESFWPWSWRLVKIENPGLTIPKEYKPGMLRAAAAEGAGTALEKLLDR